MTSLSTPAATATAAAMTSTDETSKSAGELADVLASELISDSNPITDIVKETNAITVITEAKTIATTASTTAEATTSAAPVVNAPATAGTPQQQQLTTPTKIPHLQQQQQQQHTLQSPNTHATNGKQLKQLLLHHSTDPFRRSASLRVRGTKSNLFNSYTNGQQQLTASALEHNTRYLSNIPNAAYATRHNHPLTMGVLTEQPQQQQQQHQKHNTNESHATTTAGTFEGAALEGVAAVTAAVTATAAPRHRHKAANVALLSSSFGVSTLSKQKPASTVSNLTRSQSLRRSSYHQRNYNDLNSLQQKFSKTDAIKEQTTGGGVGGGPIAANSGADGMQADVVDSSQAPIKSQQELNPADSEKFLNGNNKMQANDIMYKDKDKDKSGEGVAVANGGDGMGEQRRIDRDMQRMSLNLNGGSSSGERSTTKLTQAKLAAATPGTTSITGVGSGGGGTPTGSGSSRIATVSTPKTPQSATAASAAAVRYVKSSPIQENTATAAAAKLTPKTPPVTPDSPCTYLDDDLDSMYSFATTTSGRSTMSCEHPYVARNGTTFSGRKMKYVVHCSNYAGQVGPDYLTPTQRASRQIRRLKELLCLARQDLEQKDSEILRLTREVVELRLFKASLSSPEERSASSDAVTVREAELKTSQDVSPIVDMVDDATKSSPRHIPNHHQLHHLHQQQQQHQHQLNSTSEMQSSFADSGHFEDLSLHSKDSYAGHTQDIACGSDETIGVEEEGGSGAHCAEGCVAGGSGGSGVGVDGTAGAGDHEDYAATIKSYELQRQELIRIYEQKIEELIRTQDGASSEMKRSHNDKVEALLAKLAECNTRYADIVPDYEHAKERIRELERQLEDLQRKLAEHEDKQNKMYLHMYQKGQEAERIARADQALELAHRAPNNKVSINELLHQLQSTQDELENIRAAGCRKESGSNHALLTAKEAISLWVLGARKTIYRRLLEAQKNRTHVDPEVTLQFLKSAIYYFLTDKENSQGHLQAIESILEFTDAEKQSINKARMAK